MKAKPKRVEIPQKMIGLRLVRPARLKSEVHRSSVKILRKPKKRPK